MRAKEGTAGKAFGTIFVKGEPFVIVESMWLTWPVLGIEGLAIPIPDQSTAFCVTLDNGIDYIKTPYTTLSEGARVNQEFMLYVQLYTRV
jgi:serine/arginine repetitive matrix protein 2